MTSRTSVALKGKKRLREWRTVDRLADLDGELPA